MTLASDNAQYRTKNQSLQCVAVTLRRYGTRSGNALRKLLLSVGWIYPRTLRLREFWDTILEYWDALCARRGASTRTHSNPACIRRNGFAALGKLAVECIRNSTVLCANCRRYTAYAARNQPVRLYSEF
jgi:hypothetical protein